SARMGNHPRRALGAGGMAVRAGSRGQAGGQTGGRRNSEIGEQIAPRWLDLARCPYLCAVQEARRVERRRSLADFKVKLRRVDVAGLAGARNHLSAFDLISALDQQLLGMSVSRDVAVRMAHQDEEIGRAHV